MLELPRNLQRSVRAAGRRAPGLRQWARTLPGVVDDLAGAWSLQVGRPFQPGGVASWTAPARTEHGGAVVLKVGWRHDEALHEADALRAWDGRGAVRLLASRLSRDTSALLLEAARPGTALGEAAPPDEQDVVVADLLRRLWTTPPPGHPFRTLESMCRAWADQFEQAQFEHAQLVRRTPAAHDGPGAPVLDRALVTAGIELLRTLPAGAGTSVLLCTDLHAGNVLAAEREPWLAIDPKPHVGDPAYDPVQHLLNHPGRLHEDPLALTARLAGLLDLDVERLRLWVFARCVHASADSPHLAAVATALAP